jgi:hypothetical protein
MGTDMKEVKGLVIHGWDLLRKPTTPVHLIYGVFCAFLAYAFGFLVGFVMLGMFAKYEAWNDKGEKNRQGSKYKLAGDLDWWESFVTFCIPFCGLAILQVLDIVSIGWL